MAHMRAPEPSDAPIPEPAAELVRAIGRAKRASGRMYRAWQATAPDANGRLDLARLADEEASHARALDSLVGVLSISPLLGPIAVPTTPSSITGMQGQPWGSALMAAFALDQAATACLVGLTYATHEELARVARSIVDDESGHQSLALATFRKLTDENPGLGPRLAAEMIVARDWVRDVFPRREALDSLVLAKLLAPEAPKAHDSFLASLGDRIQDALGVLGS